MSLSLRYEFLIKSFSPCRANNYIVTEESKGKCTEELRGRSAKNRSILRMNKSSFRYSAILLELSASLWLCVHPEIVLYVIFMIRRRRLRGYTCNASVHIFAGRRRINS